MTETSVIVEAQVANREGKDRWCAIEVRYRGMEKRIEFAMPEIISMPVGAERNDMELLVCALLASKGELFGQVSRAVVLDEKRTKKRGK